MKQAESVEKNWFKYLLTSTQNAMSIHPFSNVIFIKNRYHNKVKALCTCSFKILLVINIWLVRHLQDYLCTGLTLDISLSIMSMEQMVPTIKTLLVRLITFAVIFFACS